MGLCPQGFESPRCLCRCASASLPRGVRSYRQKSRTKLRGQGLQDRALLESVQLALAALAALGCSRPWPRRRPTLASHAPTRAAERYSIIPAPPRISSFEVLAGAARITRAAALTPWQNHACTSPPNWRASWVLPGICCCTARCSITPSPSYIIIISNCGARTHTRCCAVDRVTSTCGLVAMTSASHAEGRQFDPGQVYVWLLRQAAHRLPEISCGCAV